MKLSKALWVFSFVLAAALGIIVPACNTTDEVVAPNELAPPTNLRPVADDQSVTLYWDLSSDEGDSKFQAYRILVSVGGDVLDSSQVSKGVSTKRVDLTASKFYYQVGYTFSVQSVGDGTLSQSVTVVWGKSKKSATDKTIYEFLSPSPSGLNFVSGTNAGDPAGGLLAFTVANAGQLDLWIDGRSNADVLLKSPAKYGSPMTRVTQLAEATPAVGSGSVTSLSTPTVPPASFQDTPGLVPVANKVYWAKNSDGFYVRFMVVAVGGTSPNRYVTIRYFLNDGGGAWAKRGSN